MSALDTLAPKPASTSPASTPAPATETAVAPKEYEFHRLATLFPDMPDAEYAVFAKDIAENGIRVPISLCREDGKQYIVDGKHRYKAGKACYRLTDKDFVELPVSTDLVKFVISQNASRRHLNESQRALIAANIVTVKNGANQYTKVGSSIDLPTAAKMLNVGEASVKRAKKVLETAALDVVQQVQAGKVRVSAVTKNILELPKDQQLATITADAPGPDANVAYDNAEKKLIEKLRALGADEVDARSRATITKLKNAVREIEDAATKAGAA